MYRTIPEISLPEPADYFRFSKADDFIFDHKIPMDEDIKHIVDQARSRIIDKEKYIGMSDYELRIRIKGAIGEAISKIRRNYKVAVPNCFHGDIQLLIPLCLVNPDKPDFAITVKKTGNKYIAKTSLSLEMAYSNARLITKPENNWIVTAASHVEPTMMDASFDEEV